MAVQFARPESPEWNEVDRRHALQGLATYRGPIWAFYDIGGDSCMTAWNSDDSTFGVILVGPVPIGNRLPQGWGEIAGAMARYLVSLDPLKVVRTTMPRTKPAANKMTVAEDFLWNTIGVIDVGVIAETKRGVEVLPATAVPKLAALGF